MTSMFYRKNLFEELSLKARYFIFWHSTLNRFENLLTQTIYFHDSADDTGGWKSPKFKQQILHTT